MDVRRILTPTDFSQDAQQALRWGLYWAQQFEAELHLLHVLAEYEANWHESGDAFSQLREARAQQEEKVVEGLQRMLPDGTETGVEAETAFRRGANVADTIREYADDVEADLIVMGSAGQGGIRNALLGSVADQVVRKGRRPVLTVRRNAMPSDPADVHRVLAPVDFSKHSQQAVRAAKSFAVANGAQLDMLFVAEERTVPIFNDAGLPSINTIRMDPEIVHNSKAALRQLSESVGGPDIEPNAHMAKGNVAKRIVDFAESHKVGLIVMATRGLTGLNKWLIGSVTQRVVRTASCPVVTLNTPPEEEES